MADVEVLDGSASAPPLEESLLSPLEVLLRLLLLLLSLLVELESLDPEPEPVVADLPSLELVSVVLLLLVDAEAVALPAAVVPPSPLAVGAEPKEVAAA